jgi:hypothetical protein
MDIGHPVEDPCPNPYRVVLIPHSVIKSGKTPAECIRSPQELPLQCQHLITAYSDCKKGMVSGSTRPGWGSPRAPCKEMIKRFGEVSHDSITSARRFYIQLPPQIA